MMYGGGRDNNPGYPQRKRLRLDNYDYSQGGGYFLTINVLDNIPLLGKMAGQKVLLNEVGEMVQEVWRNLPLYYPGVVSDAFVIMPNHIHGIVVLVDPWLTEARSGPVQSTAPTLGGNSEQEPPMTKSRHKPIDIPTLMRRFKSFTSKQYRDIKASHPQSRLPEKLWQRSYYERVIRSDGDMDEKREYIVSNPLRRYMKTQL